VADQAQHRAGQYPGQDQGADDVQTVVLDDVDGHAQGREHAAQHQRRYRAHPGRAQQAVRDQRRGDVDDDDLRDRAEPAG